MLRTIIENGGKAGKANVKVTAASKTGMGVVYDVATGKYKFPAAETAADIYFLDKSPVATGIDAARTNTSDYQTSFNTFAAGELAIGKVFAPGEEFATDQYDADTFISTAKGKRVSIGTDGALDIAASTVASPYIFLGTMTDGSHTLARILVADTAAKNS